jgi:hypothetical protein
MKKNIVLGLLIMATGLVLAGCASLNQKIDGSLIATKWDKNEKSTAVLYFDEDVRIHSIDGKERTNMYGQAVISTGSGTVKKPKVQLAIPAGERKLAISHKVTDVRWTVPTEVTHIFLAGRYYQLVATDNEDVKNPAFDELTNKTQATAEGAAMARADGTVGGMGAGMGAAFSAQAAGSKEYLELQEKTPMYALKLEIIDITGGKKRNSPSQILTVKGW